MSAVIPFAWAQAACTIQYRRNGWHYTVTAHGVTYTGAEPTRKRAVGQAKWRASQIAREAKQA